ncbi:hypothetical protein M427DRAFT_53427 [Gonapodya prolifera JEL478]|uniref:Uncharacterized protein n=1 Tax=Gonapodya prolifera (strain JEL478) TaxID=1344416 RepID=A0A139AQC4_GONPJ|nr:hypothetical protein M427DRAFT_53427 [Gonapodya prolifera JEL478]|eukprot:KXS18957.1 hypothetical protein M427DRAFT_53427 [Gonapodya prolifera JEL478]
MTAEMQESDRRWRAPELAVKERKTAIRNLSPKVKQPFSKQGSSVPSGVGSTAVLSLAGDTASLSSETVTMIRKFVRDTLSGLSSSTLSEYIGRLSMVEFAQNLDFFIKNRYGERSNFSDRRYVPKLVEVIDPLVEELALQPENESYQRIVQAWKGRTQIKDEAVSTASLVSDGENNARVENKDSASASSAIPPTSVAPRDTNTNGHPLDGEDEEDAFGLVFGIADGADVAAEAAEAGDSRSTDFVSIEAMPRTGSDADKELNTFICGVAARASLVQNTSIQGLRSTDALLSNSSSLASLSSSHVTSMQADGDYTHRESGYGGGIPAPVTPPELLGNKQSWLEVPRFPMTARDGSIINSKEELLEYAKRIGTRAPSSEQKARDGLSIGGNFFDDRETRQLNSPIYQTANGPMSPNPTAQSLHSLLMVASGGSVSPNGFAIGAPLANQMDLFSGVSYGLVDSAYALHGPPIYGFQAPQVHNSSIETSHLEPRLYPTVYPNASSSPSVVRSLDSYAGSMNEEFWKPPNAYMQSVGLEKQVGDVQSDTAMARGMNVGVETGMRGWLPKNTGHVGSVITSGAGSPQQDPTSAPFTPVERTPPNVDSTVDVETAEQGNGISKHAVQQEQQLDGKAEESGHTEQINGSTAGESEKNIDGSEPGSVRGSEDSPITYSHKRTHEEIALEESSTDDDIKRAKLN